MPGHILSANLVTGHIMSIFGTNFKYRISINQINGRRSGQVGLDCGISARCILTRPSNKDIGKSTLFQ